MSVDSLGIHIGPLYVRFYGIILVSGAMVGGYLSTVEARRRGLDPETVWDGLLWGLVGGIIGARLYHVFTPSPSMVASGFTTQTYLRSPILILQVWNGGLGIPGGVAGGAFALWLYTRRTGLGFAAWVDVAAPGLLLGQSIGRWGNYVNQELYGQPSVLPWAIFIEPQYRLSDYADFETFHPLFLYESILNGLGCVLLLWLARRWCDHLRAGDLFLAYLIIYPTFRFFLEFIRLDSSQLGNINANQTLSALVALTAVIAVVVRRRRQWWPSDIH